MERAAPPLTASSWTRPGSVSPPSYDRPPLSSRGRHPTAVFEHLRTRAAPGVFAFHPANGGYRRPVEAAIFKAMGVVAGVPDVIAIHKSRCFALELKAEGGRPTDKQLACLAALREAGAFTAIAEGLDRALACLESWGLLKGRVSKNKTRLSLRHVESGRRPDKIKDPPKPAGPVGV